MKPFLFAIIVIATFCIDGISQGLLQSVPNIQSESAEKVKQMLMQGESERYSGVKPSSRNYAAFKPSPSENLKNIANEMGKTGEERTAFLRLFTEAKKGFETAAADKKNNVAGAATFLIATAVSVYHETPEPSEAATDRLFHGLNSVYNEIPQMASASSNDKQFLYDLYISYGGLILASYLEAKETKNRENIDAIRVIAGSALLDFFQINPTTIYFEGDSLRLKSESDGNSQTQNTEVSQPASRSHNFTKRTTNFDDGWVATPTEDYVSVRKNDIEVRLIYHNKQVDDARPNTTPYADYYWSKNVLPYFNVSNVENLSFPVSYFQPYAMQADAVDRQTGKRVFVYLFFQGAGNHSGVTVVVASNRSAFQREFPDPRQINEKMLFYNKFGISQQDLIGTWSGDEGGYANYYNIYSGDFAGMTAVSTANDFVFRPNGTYQHIYRSANSSFGSTQFAKLEYNGKFAVPNDWEVTATNHYNGTTAKFAAQIVAVKGGYLVVLRDTRNDVTVTIFKKR